MVVASLIQLVVSPRCAPTGYSEAIGYFRMTFEFQIVFSVVHCELGEVCVSVKNRNIVTVVYERYSGFLSSGLV